MSPVSSEDSEGRLLTSSTTVVIMIIQMVDTGVSVDQAQLVDNFDTNKSTLDEAGNFSIEGVVLATQSPSS
eukprot:CAMPEP_0170982628 /NCGR_PEP_ID=MMETSP0736-20130129/3741_1 /TAXON_ID=186038 /ORGANISM="Fragilariopsis kerguelensis, Strain L26-C5" /LENGTH=70 /DNA_ID=CAMNT_0011405891 /DNA_START=35 /DNA_END=243 /DNA_ORIENTATION=-